MTATDSRAIARPLNEFSAYLFDLDGTLVDSAPDIHAALNHVLLHEGLNPVDLSLTRNFVGMGSRALITRALTHHGVADVAPEPLLERFIDFYAANIAVHSRPLTGTLQAIEGLAERGAKLAVVTNKYIGLSESVLAQLDLRRFFACVVGSETTPNPKPAADPAIYACRELGVKPHDALFIGDASPDVGCARAAGCAVVVRREGYSNGIPALELGADAVIDSITELL